MLMWDRGYQSPTDIGLLEIYWYQHISGLILTDIKTFVLT